MAILYKFTKYVYFLRNIWIFFDSLKQAADKIDHFDCDF